MDSRDNLMYIVSAVIWFFFIYYLLFSIKTDIDLWLASLILLVLAYLGTLSCPWLHKFNEHVGENKRGKKKK
ncbi:MAG: hypothetical protein WDZ69_00880 [Candidatus Pacearchaeota archaeon]